MKIVANSSPLIALAKIKKLDLLTYEIYIPRAVFEEITEIGKEYRDELLKWAKEKVLNVENKKAVEYLEIILGKGEAEAIVLSEEIKADAILIDDLKAREIATLRGLKVVGTIGILLNAKRQGTITELKPLLDELIKNGIRISKELYEHALKLAKEIE
ncbi:MAG: DUF3368 domain-containing protein [Dictyoglomus turgidum]|jgi:predicted nucleic acid-binding protein|uniref:DUF3368 domain-containing protein n=1 Tax=Dictyoglomus turgidum TaxID=513050 RepID=UPI000CCF55B1|nr:MAG: DUF3368 domain-containing protein [Dictyoglomus turgidum]